MLQRLLQMIPEEPERLRHGMRGCGPFKPLAAEPKAWHRTFFKDRLNRSSMYSISADRDGTNSGE